MRNKTIELITWVAAFMVVGSYAALSMGLVHSQSLSYQLLNFFAAAVMSLYTWKRKTYQPFFINISALTISVVTIINILQK